MKTAILSLLIGFLFISEGVNIQLKKSSLKKIEKFLNEEFPNETLSWDYFKSFGETKDIFTVKFNNISKAYLVISTAKGRYEYFDYCILYKPDFEIQRLLVLVYRSDHGMEITNKKWLSQFEGMKAGEAKSYGQDIDAISGATLSASSITKDINEINAQIIDILKP